MPLFTLIAVYVVVLYFIMTYKNKIVPALIMVISVLSICLDKSHDTTGWTLFNYVKAMKYVLLLITSK